jgi:hypothetical protein
LHPLFIDDEGTPFAKIEVIDSHIDPLRGTGGTTTVSRSITLTRDLAGDA